MSRKGLVRIVVDPEGKERRIIDQAAIHQGGDAAELDERRSRAVERFREARDGLIAALEGIPMSQIYKGDEWSVMHVLWHMADAGSVGHLRPAFDIVDRGITELDPHVGREVKYREAVEAALADIDACIAFCERVTPAQLAMTGRRNNKTVYVIGLVEQTAEHFIDHVEHITQLREKLSSQVTAAAD